MASSDVQRKLTAILCTDVVGYSRLMGDDHEGTLKTLTEYREVFSVKIKEYKGRVVNAPGDSILAEFVSVVDAVSCAVEIQRELAERNQELPENRRMDFRIGVNLGDVLVKEEELYGDGVNVAARLESLADPGGICISGNVHDQVKARLPLHFQSTGKQKVKNISEPVQTYRVLSQPGGAAHRVIRAKRVLTGTWLKGAVSVLGVLVIGAGGYWAWQSEQHKALQAAVTKYKEEAALPLPDRPSLAVLAFDNLTGDPAQEYFSDGLSEDIITKLASLSSMFVIARNSSFRYKGKKVDIRQVGRELGVRYVMEGGVQKSKGRVRITVQLIDAATGEHLFAKRYDRALKDIFAVQDEIANQVLAELHLKIGSGEGVFHALRSTNNFEAFDAYMRATILYGKFQKEANFRAGGLLLKAIEFDPKFATAMAYLGWVFMEQGRRRWISDPKKAYGLSAHWAERALKTDPNNPLGLGLMSRFQSLEGNHEEAIIMGRRAVELQPSSASNNLILAFTYQLARRPQDSLPAITRAIRLAPYPPAHYHLIAGTANSRSGRYQVSIEEYKKVLAKLRGGPIKTAATVGLIVSYTKLAEDNQARAEAENLMRENPGFTISGEERRIRNFPYKNFDFLKEKTEILRSVGLPE